MKLKRPSDIQRMREAGLLLWEVHQHVARYFEPGITTAEIDAEVENAIRQKKAIPLFKGVPGPIPYPGSACISINEQVVHGMPSDRKLEAGDIVSIDIGLKSKGWCADCAVTRSVGAVSDEKQQLMNVTEANLEQLGQQSHWSAISQLMQRQVERKGFSVVTDFVGHGIGREMWESPEVPNYFARRNKDFKIRPGLVIAIEPMVNVGTEEVITLKDGWTVVTADHKPSAHFEHSVAVTEKGPVVLTCGPSGEGWSMP